MVVVDYQQAMMAFAVTRFTEDGDRPEAFIGRQNNSLLCQETQVVKNGSVV